MIDHLRKDMDQDLKTSNLGLSGLKNDYGTGSLRKLVNVFAAKAPQGTIPLVYTLASLIQSVSLQ